MIVQKYCCVFTVVLNQKVEDINVQLTSALKVYKGKDVWVDA